MTALPDGWKVSSLGEVARWGSGGTPKAGDPRYYGGDIPWAVIGDLKDGVVRRTASSITDAGLANSSAKLVPAGSILVAMYGSIGKLGIAGMPLATNQAIACAHPGPGVDPRYLFHYLLSQRESLGRAGKGATQSNIGQGVLKAWPVPMAPLEEQRRIVDILEDHLSRLDAAQAGLRVAATRANSLRAAFLNRLFEGAPTSPLRAAVDRVEAGRSFGGSAAPAEDDEWGIIKVSAMTWGEFRADENKAIDSALADARYEIHKGDLLVSRANTTAYVGAAVLVGDTRPRLLLSDKSLRLVPVAGVVTEWLHLAVSAPRVRSQISARATGTKDSMRNISQSALLDVHVPLVSHARQIANVAEARVNEDARRALVQEIVLASTRARALRRALLSAAFAGRLTGRSSDLEIAQELTA